MVILFISIIIITTTVTLSHLSVLICFIQISSEVLSIHPTSFVPPVKLMNFHNESTILVSNGQHHGYTDAFLLC